MNPGATVATVCSGFPGPGVPAANWDRKSGFTTADEAMEARQAEDLAALSVLNAHQHLPLGFLDNEYPDAARSLLGLETVIGALLDDLRPKRCLIPLGVAHPDHVSTGNACRRALAARNGIEAIVYGDLPYRFLPDTAQSYEDAVTHALTQQVPGEGFPMTADVEWQAPSTEQPKRDATARYISQLPQLDAGAVEESMQLNAETFWHLRTLI
jgi:LmbE family N-acetylglucosaminyl deacetylase